MSVDSTVLTGCVVCVRLRAKEAELTATEKKLLSAESQVNELQARLNDAVNQRRHWEDEYNVSSSGCCALLLGMPQMTFLESSQNRLLPDIR